MTLLRSVVLLAVLAGAVPAAQARPLPAEGVKGEAALKVAMQRPHACTAMLDGATATVVCSFPDGKPDQYSASSAWVRQRMTPVPGTVGLYQDGHAGE